MDFGRILYFKGVAGQPAPFNTGEGRGLTVGASGGVDLLIETDTDNVGIGDLTPSEAKLVVRGNTAGSVGSNRQFTLGECHAGRRRRNFHGFQHLRLECHRGGRKRHRRRRERRRQHRYEAGDDAFPALLEEKLEGKARDGYLFRNGASFPARKRNL